MKKQGELIPSNMRYSYISLTTVLLLVGCGSTHYVYKQSHIISHPFQAPRLQTSTKYAYLDAVNTMRSHGRRCGSLGYFSSAPALQWNDALYHAAYEHSADMLESNAFQHGGSSTRSDWTAQVQHLGRASNFKERIENNGYKKWKRLAQNIASGMHTVKDTMQQWQLSEHHCANIMNPVFTDFGMAHTKKKGERFSDYWTQNFAAHQ
ncbi:MAG TPA: CAP domain-containing protein [Epsilonproteobacteria bacterium]|nr:CAP domain-containing protein [Campylobacterota bacterium]